MVECIDGLSRITSKELATTHSVKSEKLITEQSDEIFGVKIIKWEDSSWKYLSVIGDEQVFSLMHTKFYVFSDSVCVLAR